MKFKKNIFVILLVLSLAGNVILGILLFTDIQQVKAATKNQQINLKILSFTTLFIEKVLMSNHDVDLNTRLTLETLVRNLNDKDILNQWQQFTNAKDSQEAGNEAKVLLDLLVHKISY
jgi:hypothetical protein